MEPHATNSPAKPKWSPDEDALIIKLRGDRMSWGEVSKQFQGRSAISCRLRYQNYLERQSEWDEEKKNKFARLYERFKEEMWVKVAGEMNVPWRNAEAMHWKLGEHDMALRAGVYPFIPTLRNRSNDRDGPSRSHVHAQSQEAITRHFAASASPGPLGHQWARSATMSIPHASAQPSTIRRDPIMPPAAPIRLTEQHCHEGVPLDASPVMPTSIGPGPSPSLGSPVPFSALPPLKPPGPGLPPLQGPSWARGPTMLPSLAELTTGVRPYNNPVYPMAGSNERMPEMAGLAATAGSGWMGAMNNPGLGGYMPGGFGVGGYASDPQPPIIGMEYEPTGLKRRADTRIDLGLHETRRQCLDPKLGLGEEYSQDITIGESTIDDHDDRVEV